MDSIHERKMNELKVSIFAKVNPNRRSISNLFKTQIKQGLHACFPSFTIPSHPPYASMIERAISEMNEEKGSTKEAISAFLKREYKNLPWGHESFLSHHLRKLCVNRYIKCVNNGNYVLMVKDCNVSEITGSTKKRQARRGKRGRKQGRVKKMEKKRKPVRQEIGVVEGTKDSEKQLVEMAEIKIKESGQPDKCDKSQRNCTSNYTSYNCIMAKLKDLVFKNHVATNPSISNVPKFKSHIEQRLQELFHNFYTPTHPPYAYMIQKAILELNQKGRLCEEEISAFIKRKFKDLPFGHESFLRHHLEKICKENLVHDSDGLYVLEVKRQNIEMFNPQIGPWSQEPLHATELKYHNERTIILQRDGQEVLFNKQDDHGAFSTTTNSLGRSQNLNHNYSAPSLKDMCMESVMKTREFEEKPLGFSVFLNGMEELKYDNCGDMTDAKRKDSVQKEKLTQTQTSREEMKSNIVVIEGQKQLQQPEEKVWGLCSDSAGGGVNSRVACKGYYMPVVEEGKQLQITSPPEQRELICGLLAQQHHLPKISGKKRAEKLRQVQLSTSPELRIDTGLHLHLSSVNMKKNAPESSQADPVHQYEQQPPKRQRRGRLPKKTCDENMITKSKSPANGHGWSERQEQLERKGNARCPGLNSVADTTLALSLCSNDKQQQLPRSKTRLASKKDMKAPMQLGIRSSSHNMKANRGFLFELYPDTAARTY
ncbi:uncharacterized protein LOC8258195 isoform X1 [Ricinus communis]|uniref:uncharacterized protein LOC8258195 isoform X1 n=1 Tax=Ricinus communis TaxID=3988 RepID=UPI00201A6A2A|nr:uncharacterized protein LOC8258195 isoform X1 [Ricinus communis]